MISLIFCGDIIYCPYLKRYTERLDILRVEYEVLFWNRDGRSINESQKNYYCYNKVSPEDLGKKQKLLDFYGFRKWVIKHIHDSKSSGLILLSTLSGMLVSDLAGKYRNRYIFDIRDYSFENLKVFRAVESHVIANSFFTAISSEGFREFLPPHDYIIAHNFDRREIKAGVEFHKQDTPINFVWNGTVRYLGFQKQYIKALMNDERFRIIYHGSGQELEAFRQYVSDIGANNVFFTGTYDNANKAMLLKDASVLNNCYGGNYGDALKYAVSNRFYDGLIYRIPQLVEPGGYKAELVKKYDVGIPIVPSEHFGDWLYQYLQSIKKDEFERKCEIALEKVLSDDDKYIQSIDQFIKTMG